MWLITLPAYSEGYTVIIQPGEVAGKDTFNVSGGNLENPNSNWETYVYLLVGYFNPNYAIRRSFLQFDLSSIPSGLEVTNATLTLYAWANTHYGPVSQTVSAYRMLVDWEESQLNWYIRKTGVSWNNNGCINDGVDANVNAEDSVNIYYSAGPPVACSFNLTKLVQDWYKGIVPNYGIFLRGANESTIGKEITFASSNNPIASFRPKLEVTVIPEPGTFLLLGTGLLGLAAKLRRKL